MKPVLMIHEIKPEIFNLNLEDYILTFDDGLYSQFYYRKEFQAIPTQKIYFISSGIVSNGQQSKQFPSCVDAHEKAFNGNYEDYMTIDQILELNSDPSSYIGAHSHTHTDIRNYSLIDTVDHIKKDTEIMLNWFAVNLEMQPTRFCYPYNYDANGIYKEILKRYGFSKFYGSERISA
jgi:peptidoglycan/xylan/chitin deacetylase (PgdA/CDA1 family)